MLLALVLVQAAAGPALSVTRRPAPCPIESGQDVIVCARSPDHYRLKPLPPRADEPAIPRAETSFAGGKLTAETEQATLLGGQQSKRLMVRWKIPLGRKAQR